MIEFYEGECFAATGITPDIERTYVPVYLKRGTQLFFLTNRLVAETNETMAAANITASTLECENIKASFIASGCRFFKETGTHENPLHLLDFMKERSYTFAAFDTEDMFRYSNRKDGSVPFAVFHGNLKELSAAFTYKIFDDSLVQELKRRILPFLRQRPGKGDKSEHTPGKVIKTFADWQSSGVRTIDKYIFPGDHVDATIVDHFRNILLPAIDSRSYLQAGGEATQVKVHWPDGKARYLPTYLTFTCHGPYWTFCGICFREDTVDLTGIYEVSLQPDGSYSNFRRLHDLTERERYDMMFTAGTRPDPTLCEQLVMLCRERGTFNPLDCSLWEDPEPGEPYPYGILAFDDQAMLKLFFQYGNWSAGTGALYHDLAFVNQVSGVGDWWTLKYDHGIGQWVHFESIHFYHVIQRGEFEQLMERLDAATIPQCIQCVY